VSDRTRRYEGEDIVVAYDVKRCIHVEECVDGLPSVFSRDRRPWVDPGGAPAEDIAHTVMRCPTGALQFEKQDGAAEPVPEANTIDLDADGPLYLRGSLRIVGDDGTLTLEDTRVALCRCGASANKPFCDGRHSEIEFRDPGALGKEADRPDGFAPGGDLEVKPAPDGPYLVQGSLEIRSADQTASFFGVKAALCRCGASQNKPFCDGSHKQIGFTSG